MSFQPRFINGKLPTNQPTNQRSCANKACAVTSPLSSVHPEKIHLQIHGGTLKKNTQGILIFNPGLSNSSHTCYIFFLIRGGGTMLAGYQQLMLLLRYLLILANQGLIAPFGGLSSSDSCDDTKWILENLHEKKNPTAKKMATVFKTVYLYDGFKTQDYDAWWIGWCLLRFRAEAPPKIRNWHQKNWTVDHLVPLGKPQKKKSRLVSPKSRFQILFFTVSLEL